MALKKEEKAEIVKQFGKDEKDTGNTKVQIALLTKEINDLNDHLKENKHDYSSKRALFVKVGERSSLLSYLDRADHAAYLDLIKKLNIRK
ncbi:MAG: 30S ribosomal protein S15 [Bacilli bacterium]|jgi:small subunit ribosomal protein S15|nr:30S ribosomal protein S15 [Bacilli bacterium]